jgi:hypothetical protein
MISTAVEAGVITPARSGRRYDVVTVGLIDFAHLYVHSSRPGGLIAPKFAGDPTSFTLDNG